MKSDFFYETILYEIEPRISKENAFATRYVQLYVDNYSLYLSNLVGQVNFPVDLEEGSVYSKGKVIFKIISLGICYEVIAEMDGIIKKVYPFDGGIVMYGDPVILIEKSPIRKVKVN